MKVIVDNRPRKDNQPACSFLRLYPETGEEMAAIEWAMLVGSLAENNKVIRNPQATGGMSYVIELFYGSDDKAKGGDA